MAVKSSELAKDAGSTYSFGSYALYDDDLIEPEMLDATEGGLLCDKSFTSRTAAVESGRPMCAGVAPAVLYY